MQPIPFLALLFALVLAGPAFAQDAPAAPAAAAQRVEIVTDQQNGAVRIVIDGKDVAVIDADGLHVSGSVTYTGTMTNTGGGARAE